MDLICGESSKYLKGAVFAYFYRFVLCIQGYQEGACFLFYKFFEVGKSVKKE